MSHPSHTKSIPVLEADVANKTESLPVPLVVSKFYVKSDIRFRFATTVMSTMMFNTNAHSSTEATFSAELPEKAYISYFTMTIAERVIVGEVKEKKQAKEKYDSASARGETAALVSEVPRETNRFDISVNVAASSSVLFDLTYVEVLERKLSCYRHILNIKPNQIVEDYLIHVSIHESRKIQEVKVPPISSDISKEHLTLDKILQNQNNVDISYNVSGKSCDIMYKPTIQQQKEIHQDLGVNGQFSVFYDVSRQDDAGDILVSNGYFLHFFAPDSDEAGVTILPKQVVFILDTSGSMCGKKIMQLKDAMVRILAELNDEDCFNIIEFNSDIKTWRNDLQTIGKREEGKTFVNNLKANGGTNISDALSKGFSMLKQNQQESVIPTIFFLTDGLPNCSTYKILQDMRQQNELISARIYSLAFGDDADLHFLQQLSSDHGGVCRKIYMDSDADLQVSGFYKEISSPLLSHINITYMNEKEDQEEAEIKQSLCQLKRGQVLTGSGVYYSGDEYVVCGRAEGGRVIGKIRGMKGGRGMINMKVEGKYMEDEGGDVGQVIEKVWACLTIKRILAEMDETSSSYEKENLRNEALQLSLKYGLVTTLTSMVVTEENADEREIEKYKERPAIRAVDKSGSGFCKSYTKCIRKSKSRFCRRESAVKRSLSRSGHMTNISSTSPYLRCSNNLSGRMKQPPREGILSSARQFISGMFSRPGPPTMTTHTLYDGKKDSPVSDVFIRANVKDSLIVEVMVELSTYTIKITPHQIQVTNNVNGHTQSHKWEEYMVQAGGFTIKIYTDTLEIKVEGENKLKFRISREKNVRRKDFLHFTNVTKAAAGRLIRPACLGEWRLPAPFSRGCE